MGADPTVHAATTEDLDGTRSVARVAWHEVYDDLLGERTVDRMLSTGYADDVLERIAGLEDVELFVAEVDDRVVGYASCDRTDTVGIGDLDIYLHPDYWGEGVGERLLERGSDHLSSLGVRRVRDEVLVSNEVGNAFYRDHFEHVGRRADFGGETRAVNVYERSIA